jgi:hypothetical protein
MTRYRLPVLPAEADGEVLYDSQTGTEVPMLRFKVGDANVIISAELLTKVKPALPDEPEPGAYLRGGLTLIGVPVDPGPGPDEPRCVWYVFTARRSVMNHLDWYQAVDETGGPDVSIVPLVPKVPALPEVTLPWKHKEGQAMIKVFGPGGAWIEVIFPDGGGITFRPDPREMAAALLLAAGHKAIEEAGRD